MAENERRHRIREGHPGDDLGADLRVDADLLELLRGERSWLGQDVLGHGQLPDVMEQRRGPDALDLVVLIAIGGRRRRSLDAPNMVAPSDLSRRSPAPALNRRKMHSAIRCPRAAHVEGSLKARCRGRDVQKCETIRRLSISHSWFIREIYSASPAPVIVTGSSWRSSVPRGDPAPFGVPRLVVAGAPDDLVVVCPTTMVPRSPYLWSSRCSNIWRRCRRCPNHSAPRARPSVRLRSAAAFVPHTTFSRAGSSQSVVFAGSHTI